MTLVNTKSGKQVSSLWLIPFVPVFLVGLFSFVVAGLTCMVVGVEVLDASPALAAGPAPIGVDELFVTDMLRFDHWLVGLVGLSCPWLMVIPGYISSVVWEWATRSR